MPTMKEIRATLWALIQQTKHTNWGTSAHAVGLDLVVRCYTEEEQTHVLMMASRHGLECANFADCIKQNGTVRAELWLDAREA